MKFRMSSRADRYRVLFFLVLTCLMVLLVRDYYYPQLSDDRQPFNYRRLRGETGGTGAAGAGGVEKEKILEYDHNLPIIWIGGVPRSGTTLARAMLDAHPDVRCGEETRVIPRLLFMHNKMMASPIERSRLVEAKVTDNVLNEALGAYILSIILGHGEPAPRYCNKDPFTLKSLDRIMKIFPNSKFILMIRDGRAVAHSIITRKVSITGFDIKTYRGALRDWSKSVLLMWAKCRDVGTSVCLPVYYEQLILHPEKEMKRITEFLQVPWDDIVLHHEQTIGKAGGISLSKRERSTDQVARPVNINALYKWVEAIPDDVKRDMASIAPALSILGYDPHANPPKYGEPDDLVKSNTNQLNLPSQRSRQQQQQQQRQQRTKKVL